MVVILLEEILQSVLFDLRHRDLPRTAWLQLTWWWNGMTGWQDDIGWHPVKDGKLWKLLSWRLDILPAKFRSTADTSENLQISIPSIHQSIHTIFGEGTNAVAGEYLGSIRSCQRLETFSCKQSRGYTAGVAGYRGIWKGHTAKIFWQKFKIEIKKCFFGEWRQSLSCSNPSFGHPQLQIRWSGTGISTRFALLVSIHANLKTHFKRFLHDSQIQFLNPNPKIQKLNLQSLQSLQSLLNDSIKKIHPHPCAHHPCGDFCSMEGWPPQKSPKISSLASYLSPHSCHVRSHGWSPSRRWWSQVSF